MNLYLMQHGIANPKDIDPDENLTEKGSQIILASAKALKKINISFDVIICSPKNRSKQTAKIIAKEFKFPEKKIIETDKVKPLSLPEETIDFISEYERVFIAGHLPSIKQIISYLLCSGANIDVDIHNGGCTRIDIENKTAILKWHLTPNILKLLKD